MSFGANYRLVIAAAAVALVAFAVARSLWQIFRGTVELDAGGSWGRQAISRQARGGKEMSAWVAGTLAALCFAAAIAVIVLLVWWF